MITDVDDLNCWNISEEEIGPSKKYVCGIDGCIKSYSNRQNCYRHRNNDHKMSSKSKSVDLTSSNSASLQRERDFVVETYATLYEKYGEDAAAEFLKENKKIAEHLVPLRRMIETEVADRLADAKESQSILEVKLTDFKKSIPNDATDEMAAFNAVIKLVRKANPESISYLKQFSRVITLLVDHMSDYSEGVNPKFKQSRALKKVLDELFMGEVDRLELAPTPPTNGKRKAAVMTELNSASLDLNSNSGSASSTGTAVVSSPSLVLDNSNSRPASSTGPAVLTIPALESARVALLTSWEVCLTLKEHC
jgi:hypothetical protein